MANLTTAFSVVSLQVAIKKKKTDEIVTQVVNFDRQPFLPAAKAGLISPIFAQCIKCDSNYAFRSDPSIAGGLMCRQILSKKPFLAAPKECQSLSNLPHKSKLHP